MWLHGLDPQASTHGAGLQSTSSTRRGFTLMSKSITLIHPPMQAPNSHPSQLQWVPSMCPATLKSPSNWRQLTHPKLTVPVSEVSQFVPHQPAHAESQQPLMNHWALHLSPKTSALQLLSAPCSTCEPTGGVACPSRGRPAAGGGATVVCCGKTAPWVGFAIAAGLGRRRLRRSGAS